MSAKASITKYSDIVCVALSGEDILLSVTYDVSRDGTYTEGIFAVSRHRLCVVENERLILAENIENIEKVCMGEYTGGGILEAFTVKGRKQLVRFSMKHIEEFTSVCEIINDLAEGLEPVINEKTFAEDRVCPKCGRAYINNTAVCPNCSDKFSVLKKLFKLAKPYKGLYITLLLLFWITSIVTVVTPILSKHLINDVLNIKNASISTLLIIVGLMLVTTVISMVVSVFRSIISSRASNLLVMDLRNHIYEKLQKMPLSYIEEKKTGDLMQRINNDTQRIQTFIQDIAIMAVNEACLFIAIAAITIYLDAKMSLLIFLPMPVALYLIAKIRLNIRSRYHKQWRKMDKMTNRLAEVLNGIKVVKVFGRENDEIDRFKKTAGDVRDITCANEKYVYTIFPTIKFIMGFGGYLVLLFGGSKVLGGTMSVGELVQFSTYGGYLYSRLEWFSMLPRHFTMALVSSQRVFEVLEEEEQYEGDTKASAEKAEGSFTFDNVSFGYKSYRRVLKNIQESVQKGEMIGLVGHSGAGKSTMINLIMRLYSPDRGKIMLDGSDISEYNQQDYKNLLGVVLQESYLFSGSILDNLKYAAPKATLEDCIIAAKKANAHDFIMELPDGYNTYVGEKGYKLSGGERQRISIARAIVANPKILILDEATASVDSDTELEIQEALKKVTEGKTVFAIAHRLSTLKNADRLFVLDNGKIAETGTHKELIEKNGIYASLLRAQQEMAAREVTIDNSDKIEENTTPTQFVNEGEEFDNEQD